MSSVELAGLGAGVIWIQGAGGVILAGAARQVKVFQKGTQTQQPVYSDAALTVQMAQPLTTDSAGRVPGYVAVGASLDIFDVATSTTLSVEAASGSGGGGGGGGAVASVNGQVGVVVLTAAQVNAVATSAVGVASGVASLDSSGNVPLSQLGNAPGAPTVIDGGTL